MSTDGKNVGTRVYLKRYIFAESLVLHPLSHSSLVGAPVVLYARLG